MKLSRCFAVLKNRYPFVFRGAARPLLFVSSLGLSCAALPRALSLAVRCALARAPLASLAAVALSLPLSLPPGCFRVLVFWVVARLLGRAFCSRPARVRPLAPLCPRCARVGARGVAVPAPPLRRLASRLRCAPLRGVSAWAGALVAAAGCACRVGSSLAAGSRGCAARRPAPLCARSALAPSRSAPRRLRRRPVGLRGAGCRCWLSLLAVAFRCAARCARRAWGVGLFAAAQLVSVLHLLHANPKILVAQLLYNNSDTTPIQV